MQLTLNTSALPTFLVDSAGNIIGPTTISLASAATLAAGASTATVPVKSSGTFALSYILAGTSPNLALQCLGIDGATWTTVVTVTASGSQPIDLYAGSGGAAVRLTNLGTNTITGLSAGLVR